MATKVSDEIISCEKIDNPAITFGITYFPVATNININMTPKILFYDKIIPVF